jgi:hypothetical protein
MKKETKARQVFSKPVGISSNKAVSKNHSKNTEPYRSKGKAKTPKKKNSTKKKKKKA